MSAVLLMGLTMQSSGHRYACSWMSDSCCRSLASGDEPSESVENVKVTSNEDARFGTPQPKNRSRKDTELAGYGSTPLLQGRLASASSIQSMQFHSFSTCHPACPKSGMSLLWINRGTAARRRLYRPLV
jgi:hypothetical protein